MIRVRISPGPPNVKDASESHGWRGKVLDVSISLPENASINRDIDIVTDMILCCSRRVTSARILVEGVLLSILGLLFSIPFLPERIKSIGILFGTVTAALVLYRLATYAGLEKCKRGILRGVVRPLPSPQREVIKEVILGALGAVRECSSKRCTTIVRIRGTTYHTTIRHTPFGTLVVMTLKPYTP
ncbi:MAG: hypothetical protein F7C35_08180 [Desulfurococcales archaeon]|nr:hypothetical protein [Desulfurococcales archaeon]